MNIAACRGHFFCSGALRPSPIFSRSLRRSQSAATIEHKSWRGGRAVDCTGLENRQAERPREFESHPLRQTVDAAGTLIGRSPECFRSGDSNGANWEAATWMGRPERRVSGSERVNAVRLAGRVTRMGENPAAAGSLSRAKARLWIIPPPPPFKFYG